MKTKLLLMACLGAVLAMPAGRADGSVSLSVDIRIGKALPPPPPEVVVVEHVGPVGPPPWAASHWYRRTRAYYYYPDCDVYYRPADRMWFYLDGGAWRVGVTLPDRIVFDVSRSVRLSMETDRPFAHHKEVVAYYPPSYFNHVRIKGDHGGGPGGVQERKAGDENPGNSGGNSGGKGKEKGKGKDKDKDKGNR